MSSEPPERAKHPEAASGAGDVARGGGVTLLGAAVGSGFLLLNEIVVARLLGVEVYGLYALGYVVCRVGEALSSAGIQLGIVHFVPIHRATADRARLLGVIVASLVLPAAIGSALALLLFVLAPWLASDIFGKPELAPYLRIMACAIPLLSLLEIVGNTTRALGHAKYYVWMRNVAPHAAFLVFLVVMAATGAGPHAIAVAFVAAYGVAMATGGVLLLRLLGSWEQPSREYASLYRYSLPILFNMVFYLLVGWTDILMVGGFLSADQVGIYNACFRFMLVFDMIGTAGNAATAHLYPLLMHEERLEELRDTYGGVLGAVGALIALAFLLIALNARDLLGLLGPAFGAGAPTLVVLVSAMMVRSFFNHAGFVLVVTGRQRLDAANAGVSAVANVVLNLLLIPHYGILGAALATGVSALLLSALRAIQVRRAYRLRAFEPLTRRLAVVAAAVGLLVLFASDQAGLGDGITPMAIRMSVTVPLLAAGFWTLALDADQRRTLWAALASATGTSRVRR